MGFMKVYQEVPKLWPFEPHRKVFPAMSKEIDEYLNGKLFRESLAREWFETGCSIEEELDGSDWSGF